MRIQIFPPRFTERVMARRAASICRVVIHAVCSARNPYAPKASVTLLVATRPVRPRPLCHFRCLTFFGINIFHVTWSMKHGTQIVEQTLHALCFMLQVSCFRFLYLLGEYFSTINPNLYADCAVNRPCKP